MVVDQNLLKRVIFFNVKVEGRREEFQYTIFNIICAHCWPIPTNGQNEERSRFWRQGNESSLSLFLPLPTFSKDYNLSFQNIIIQLNQAVKDHIHTRKPIPHCFSLQYLSFHEDNHYHRNLINKIKYSHVIYNMGMSAENDSVSYLFFLLWQRWKGVKIPPPVLCQWPLEWQFHDKLTQETVNSTLIWKIWPAQPTFTGRVMSFAHHFNSSTLPGYISDQSNAFRKVLYDMVIW